MNRSIKTLISTMLALTMVSGCSEVRQWSGKEKVDPLIAYHSNYGKEPKKAGPSESAPSTETGTAADESRAVYLEGSGEFYKPSAPQDQSFNKSEEGLTLNFSNTDIPTLVGAVLGDMLGLPYQISPSVKGNLTLQTRHPVSEQALLPTLEAALRSKNYAVINQAGVYHVMPVAEAPQKVSAFRQPTPQSAGLPGYGVMVVPMKYTSAGEMKKVLEPFAPRGGVLRVDEARNFVILAGTSEELTSMLQTVETFDVDWMKGMSFALYKLRYVDAKTVSDELLEIFGDLDSPVAGMVKLIPIPRLNTVLGVSAQPEYLKQVEKWIEQLDLGGGTPGRRIYVYKVKHGRASDLAGALGSILAIEGQRSGSNSAGMSKGKGAGTSLSPKSSGAGGGMQIGQRSSNLQQAGGRVPGQGKLNSKMTGEPNAFESGGLRIVPNEESNSILILASASEYSVIESALDQIDKPPLQVLIEASLAEVSLNDELKYGVQWYLDRQQGSVAFSQSSGGGAASSFPGFSFVYEGVRDARAVLNALSSVTDVKIVSSPKLMVLNNQTAMLQVGDQVPVATQSAKSVSDGNSPIVNTVQFKDTGVIMEVTPRIGDGGAVMLDISQEVSEVAATTSSGIDSPTIRQRKISSTVVVQDGDTIALGGLIRDTVSRGKSGVPILKSIPVVGNAFRSNNSLVRRSELIILITTRIAKDARATQQILEDLQKQFRNTMELETRTKDQ